MEIKQLIEESRAYSALHGWQDKPRTFEAMISLLHSEVSEAFEAYRNNYPYSENYYFADNNNNLKPEGIPSELADVILRVTDICAQFNIDLEAAIIEKKEYNKTRPYQHGGKRL
jgi:NTP pyrophosphatase (non-canonical NTP hydrolase)